MSCSAPSQRRDPAAGAAALASIRAEFGNAAVACAVLEEAHLPEAQYRWQPVDRLVEAQPLPLTAPSAPLVRRVLAGPQPIAAARRPGPALAGPALAGPAGFGPPRSDAVRRDSAHTGARRAHRHCGPFLVSSGWWWTGGGTPNGGTPHGSSPAGQVRDNHVRYDGGSAGGDRTAPALAHAGADGAEPGSRLASTPADRAYYFINSADGALEWVYYDLLTRRWYRQGWVE